MRKSNNSAAPESVSCDASLRSRYGNKPASKLTVGDKAVTIHYEDDALTAWAEDAEGELLPAVLDRKIEVELPVVTSGREARLNGAPRYAGSQHKPAHW